MENQISKSNVKQKVNNQNKTSPDPKSKKSQSEEDRDLDGNAEEPRNTDMGSSHKDEPDKRPS